MYFTTNFCAYLEMKGKDLHGSNDIVSLMTEFFSITTQN